MDEDSVYDQVIPNVMGWFSAAKHLGVDLEEFDCNACVDQLVEMLSEKIPDFMILIINQMYVGKTKGNDNDE